MEHCVASLDGEKCVLYLGRRMSRNMWVTKEWTVAETASCLSEYILPSSASNGITSILDQPMAFQPQAVFLSLLSMRV